MPRVVGALAGAVREVVRVDRAKLSGGPALRASLGMAIPLVAGEAAGHLLVSVTAAIGALAGGLASLQGTYRSRAGLVVMASTGMGLSALVGTTVGHVAGVDIALVAAWGLAAGLLVVFGQAATVVGLQSVVGLLVFSQFTLSLREAAVRAGLVVAGGVLQALLVAVVWPLRRFPAERMALASAYRQLSGYARTVVGSPTSLLGPGVLDDLGTALRDPQPFGARAEMAAYQGLVDQAERVRLALASLATAPQRLSAAGAGDAASALDTAAGAAARLLAAVAEALETARGARPSPQDWAALDQAIDRLRTTAEGGDRSPGGWREAVLRQAHASCEALAGQLRSIVRLAGVPAGEEADLYEDLRAASQPGSGVGTWRRCSTRTLPVRETLQAVRANLTLESEGCRHAIRLAAALALAQAISHLFPLGHGYWLPLTVVIVLKPDFAATFTRGVARCLGTLAGAGLVTAVVATLRPGATGLVVLTLVLYWAAVTFLLANYAVFSVCVAALVVTLLGFTGQPELSLAADRSFYTVLGGALALLAYALWPTWERAVVRDRLARLVEADGRYGEAVLEAWADPAVADPAALHHDRLQARLARSNAEASVDRWMAEPAAQGLSPDLARGILAAVRPYVQAVLTLHLHLPPAGPPRPEVGALANQVRRATAAVAAVLRRGSSTQPLPPLRTVQLNLAAQLGASPTHRDGAALDDQTVVLVSETDAMVNAVDTLGDLAGLQPTPGPGPPAGLQPTPRPGPPAGPG